MDSPRIVVAHARLVDELEKLREAIADHGGDAAADVDLLAMRHRLDAWAATWLDTAGGGR